MLGKFKSCAPRNVLTLTMSHGNSGVEIRSNNVNEMKDLKDSRSVVRGVDRSATNDSPRNPVIKEKKRSSSF